MNSARRMVSRVRATPGSSRQGPHIEMEANIPPVVMSTPAAFVESQNSADEKEMEPTEIPRNEQVEEEIPVRRVPRVSFDSDNSGDELEKNAIKRQRICPKGKTFQDNDEKVVRVITSNIHKHFKGAFTSCRKVRDDHRKIWWAEFQKHFFWKDCHATRIKALWKSKCSQSIRNAFCDARKAMKKPGWLGAKYWDEMLKDWEQSDNFKRMSETNKRNRASEGLDGFLLYTGGSRSVVKNVGKIEKESGRRMTQEELIMAMYHSKNKGKYTSDRPQKTIDCFNRLCSEWKECYLGEEMSQEEINKLWLNACGGSEKGIYGQGSLYHKTDDVLNPAVVAPSSPPPASSSLPRAPSPVPRNASPLPRAPTPSFPTHVASPSSHETATQSEVADLRRALQQQELIQQIMMQQQYQERMPRMDTSRSPILPSNRSFQSLSHGPGPGPSVYGGDGAGGFFAAGTSLPYPYRDDRHY